MSEENQTQTTYRLESHGKSMIVAYLLWWFLGWLGVHRFYLGRPISGLAQAILSLVGTVTLFLIIGIIPLLVWGAWWLIDAYLVQKYVTSDNRAHGITDGAGISVSMTRRGTTS